MTIYSSKENPILAAFRPYARNRVAGYWVHRLDRGDLPEGVTASQDHLAHARRVLTRLAAV